MNDERGATMIEMAVVMTVLGFVISMAMTSLLTVLRTSASVEDRTIAASDARLAIDQLAGELRGASISAPASPNAARNSITFTEPCGTTGVGDCTAAGTRTITYSLAGNAITRTTSAGVRTIIGPIGVSAVAAASQRDAVVNNAASQPLFDYLDKSGNAFDTSATSSVPVNSFRDCVEQVRVHLVTNAEAARATTVDLTTTVRLRNYTLVAGC